MAALVEFPFMATSLGTIPNRCLSVTNRQPPGHEAPPRPPAATPRIPGMTPNTTLDSSRMHRCIICITLRRQNSAQLPQSLAVAYRNPAPKKIRQPPASPTRSSRPGPTQTGPQARSAAGRQPQPGSTLASDRTPELWCRRERLPVQPKRPHHSVCQIGTLPLLAPSATISGVPNGIAYLVCRSP
jgi:hypothetical protein